MYFDPSQNFLERPFQPLDAIFTPKSVAVVGATEAAGSVGRTLIANLLAGGLEGKIYPVNPQRQTVLGHRCFPSISAIGAPIDLAVIVTPAKAVLGVVKECAALGVSGAIIISAGFKELGESGLALEQEILHSKGSMRIIGPNCLGVMNPITGLNATFAAKMAYQGHIAFISQSGAMCTAVLDWSLKEKIGFSAFVSIGSMADINWGDLIDYLGSDPHTESILMYMETIGDARSFLSAAREVALTKPIIVIKAGRSAAAAKAAASHTGSLAGSDEVFEAAMHRAGVLRVDTISELFDMALVLGKQPRPKGPNLAIVTNAGGPAVLATDAAVLGGACIASLSPSTIQALNQFLPAAWSHSNPVDLLGDASPERYAQAINIVAKDPHTDGILVVLSPQDMTDSRGTAEALKACSFDKPLLASWMGGSAVAQGVDILNASGIPSFDYPDSASRAFATMWRQSDDLNALYETPLVRDVLADETRRKKGAEIIQAALRAKRILLTEFESKEVLSAYGIPTAETVIASTCQEATSAAKQIGFPVVLKLQSETITHKTEVGGVKLNLKNEKEVELAFEAIRSSVTKQAGADHFQGVTVQPMIRLEGYELIIGSSIDPQFGPIILFGTGGQLVEVYKDSALGLPPLNTTLARRLMQQTKIYAALQGVRGRRGIDQAKLEELLVRFSQLIIEQPQIKECDINPLLASCDQLIALDARIVLHDPNRGELSIPAIRPYPIEYVLPWKLKDGRPITLRPIRPEDEPQLIAFHRELSEESVRQRYFAFLSLNARIAHHRLRRVCMSNYEKEISILAETEGKQILGLARLSRLRGTPDAEFKMIIADHSQHLGLGKKLLAYLLEIAAKEKIRILYAHILQDNIGMIHICRNFGFSLTPTEENRAILKAEKTIV